MGYLFRALDPDGGAPGSYGNWLGKELKVGFMGRLFVLIGKSASGKDAIYKRLLCDPLLQLRPYVGYTTRPIRSGEEHGREYYFTDVETMEAYRTSGKLIETRVYHTVHGDWYYYSVDNESVDLNSHDYLYIGTLQSYLPLREYYGTDRVIPIYVEVEDGLRLQRALDRERSQEVPRYAEMCRRFLMDEEDFCEENLQRAGIERRFQNEEMELCLGQIREMIETMPRQ